MGTPFYQPDNSAGNQGANPNPWDSGGYPHPEGNQSPTPQPFYGGQPPASHNHVPQNYPMGMPQYGYQPQPAQTSMVLAALLALFLGHLGVHNFYLGYTRAGLVQLGLSIAGWVLAIVLIGFVFLFVVGVWAFIDFILILMRSGRFRVDASGVPLQ